MKATSLAEISGLGDWSLPEGEGGQSLVACASELASESVCCA
jgi:hypothetical protein